MRGPDRREMRRQGLEEGERQVEMAKPMLGNELVDRQQRPAGEARLAVVRQGLPQDVCCNGIVGGQRFRQRVPDPFRPLHQLQRFHAIGGEAGEAGGVEVGRLAGNVARHVRHQSGMQQIFQRLSHGFLQSFALP